MNKRNIESMSKDVVFRPAVAPLEASVIPAVEKQGFGALHLVKESFNLKAGLTDIQNSTRMHKNVINGRRFE